MSDSGPSSFQRHFAEVVSASIQLMQGNENEKALSLVDGAIEEAVRNGENDWVISLSQHAAVLVDFLGMHHA